MGRLRRTVRRSRPGVCLEAWRASNASSFWVYADGVAARERRLRRAERGSGGRRGARPSHLRDAHALKPGVRSADDVGVLVLATRLPVATEGGKVVSGRIVLAGGLIDVGAAPGVERHCVLWGGSAPGEWLV